MTANSSDPIDLAVGLHTEAMDAHDRGDAPAAKALSARAVALLERHAGRDHPDTANARNLLSKLHLEEMDHRTAERLARASVAGLRWCRRSGTSPDVAWWRAAARTVRRSGNNAPNIERAEQRGTPCAGQACARRGRIAVDDCDRVRSAVAADENSTDPRKRSSRTAPSRLSAPMPQWPCEAEPDDEANDGQQNHDPDCVGHESEHARPRERPRIPLRIIVAHALGPFAKWPSR